MRHLIILLISIGISVSSFGQERLGLLVENYAGVNSLLINPSNMAHSPFRWDLNLVAGGAFFENNYAYFRDANLSVLSKNSESIVAITEYDSESQIPDDALVLDFNDKTHKKFLLFDGFAMGPSFALRLDSGHSFGFISRFRTMIGARNIPFEFSYRVFDDTPFFDGIILKPFKTGGMAWAEYGLNYTYSIETVDGYLNIGATVKMLNGYEAFYFRNNRDTEVVQIPGDTLELNQANFEYGFTTSNTSGDGVNRSVNGSGIGVDLGANYTFDVDIGLRRVGAAFLDLGRLNFNKNTVNYKIDSDDRYVVTSKDYTNDDPITLSQVLSNDLMQDSTASAAGRSFALWLPMALSLQADVALHEYFGANATIVKSIPTKSFGVERGDMFALTPYFSHRWFSASMPFVLYNWRELNVGLSLRLAFLTIGSDNIGSFIGKSDFTGSDIYVALKVNPFNLGIGGGGGGWKRGKKVKCYDF